MVIAAVVAFAYAAYYIFSGAGGNLAGLAVIIGVLFGSFCLLLYWVFRKLFKNRAWVQVVTELLIILALGLNYYYQKGQLMLHVPAGYQGYILVLYGAEKHPALSKAGIFDRDVHVTVPASGIIMTSGGRSRNISVVDGSGDKARTLRPGYGLPFAWDTLRCDKKEYFLDVLLFGPLPANWEYYADSISRTAKKDLACTQL